MDGLGSGGGRVQTRTRARPASGARPAAGSGASYCPYVWAELGARRAPPPRARRCHHCQLAAQSPGARAPLRVAPAFCSAPSQRPQRKATACPTPTHTGRAAGCPLPQLCQRSPPPRSARRRAALRTPRAAPAHPLRQLPGGGHFMAHHWAPATPRASPVPTCAPPWPHVDANLCMPWQLPLAPDRHHFAADPLRHTLSACTRDRARGRPPHTRRCGARRPPWPRSPPPPAPPDPATP